jgi:hypothetical protein
MLLQPHRSFIDVVDIAAGRAVMVQVGESAGAGAGAGLGFYYYGDDHGAAAVVVADPLAYYAAG